MVLEYRVNLKFLKLIFFAYLPEVIDFVFISAGIGRKCNSVLFSVWLNKGGKTTKLADRNFLNL